MAKLTGRQELLIAVTNEIHNTGQHNVIEAVSNIYNNLTQTGKNFANGLVGIVERRFVTDVEQAIANGKIYEIADFR